MENNWKNWKTREITDIENEKDTKGKKLQEYLPFNYLKKFTKLVLW